MEVIQVNQLTFHYPDAKGAALDEVSFHVKQGEFVVLCGASGCGKTTLLRHLKKETLPVGKRSGSVKYNGALLEELPAALAAEQIGMVFQNPENQIVMDQVWHELAFSMENVGYEQAVMRKRLAEMSHFFGLEELLYKSVHEISGGQKQLINLASVMLLQPKLLLLDEPTSQLDPVAARDFLQLIYRLNQEMSMTVIISEHRLEDVIPLADRIVMLEGGRVKYDAAPRELCQSIGDQEAPNDLSYLPSVTKLFLSALPAGNPIAVQEIPLTVREGKRWLAGQDGIKTDLTGHEGNHESKVQDAKQRLLACDEITFKYEKTGSEVLKKLSLNVYKHEFLAVLGGNGAGKTTMLQMMAGLLQPQRGRVKKEKNIKVGYLAQNPLLYFSYDTVEEELQRMAAYAGLVDREGKIARIVDALQIAAILPKHPYDLSGGEQQRAALALVLLGEPEVLCLDEPTKGLDPIAKQRTAELLQQLCQLGKTIVMVTHDIEFAAEHATRCAMLFDGAIAAEAAPALFFGTNYFYTTAINRTVREWLPDALTVKDVIDRWAN
ncbi:ABC transporter ATP-binding protein [Paenibacillus sp. PL91]|uniref:ABC transporter ATP-binding protein n=1 Tax=Paenibacillus sp. PL91 TaxID=2729538 RepID=UPI00145F1732|nr:ABC transporter ATP-binding protein [Paenibacillus sp. PL91]MBC9201243.1 ATP-binding cassette domain-containing protein [Paenibacillus sp. PL91]